MKFTHRSLQLFFHGKGRPNFVIIQDKKGKFEFKAVVTKIGAKGLFLYGNERTYFLPISFILDSTIEYGTKLVLLYVKNETFEYWQDYLASETGGTKLEKTIS